MTKKIDIEKELAKIERNSSLTLVNSLGNMLGTSFNILDRKLGYVAATPISDFIDSLQRYNKPGYVIVEEYDYESCSHIKIYEHQLESDRDFEVRKDSIRKCYEERNIKIERANQRKKEQEKQLYEKLRKKFEKER